eukprot:GHVU01236045.1.p1 GENE.GHVU01236045.1~~GHVU01236045.1.p1  ORF type:complete len:196 (-),score=10.57 GHVU01236045.1:904-1491(-)
MQMEPSDYDVLKALYIQSLYGADSNMPENFPTAIVSQTFNPSPEGDSVIRRIQQADGLFLPSVANGLRRLHTGGAKIFIRGPIEPETTHETLYNQLNDAVQKVNHNELNKDWSSFGSGRSERSADDEWKTGGLVQLEGGDMSFSVHIRTGLTVLVTEATSKGPRQSWSFLAAIRTRSPLNNKGTYQLKRVEVLAG